MGIFDLAATAISIGSQLASGFQEAKAAKSQAAVYSAQAAYTLEFGEEQARFAREMADLEAALLERQGTTAEEIAAFNADVARRNADWEQRAGDIQLSRARRAGEARLSSISAALASQGRVVADTTSDALLAESLAELERDFTNIALTTQTRVRQQRDQARLFELQGTRAGEFSAQQASGRRRAGEIEATGLLRSAELDAAGANVRAGTVRQGARSSLLGSFADVAGLFLS